MTLRSIAICGFVALLASACGNGGPEENNGAPEVEPGTVVERLATAQCAKIFECCSGDELSDVFGAVEVEDEEACRAALTSQAEAFFRPALERSIESDTVRLHDDLDACVTALNGRSCAGFDPKPNIDLLDASGCETVVEPRLSLSAFCAEDYECRTGFCSRPPGEAEGACKNPPAVDEPCLNDRCGAGLHCTVDDVCAEKLGAGAICTRNADCASDSCVPGDDGEFVCAEIPDICGG